MDNPTILVIDSDPKNLQILKESLESSNFKVITSSDGNEAWSTIQSQKPDMVVSEVDIPGMDGFKLFEKMQNDPVGASTPVVFLTNRHNLEDRLKGLRSGVKDYMIKPLHVKEVIARLNMILRRIDRIKTEESGISRKLTGRLEEVSVEHLVENYGVERKTGILTLYDQKNRSGEIYFRKGSVVNARLGNFKAEKAVYQMLPWKEGHFMMTFKDVNVDDAITVSNLGLLLQGFKRLQDREKLIKHLPSLDTVFVKTTIFNQVLKKKAVSTDALKFISLFDGTRSVNDIMTESTYDDIKTLERIIKLNEQGFICRKDASTQAVPKLRRSPTRKVEPKPEAPSDFTEIRPRPVPQEPVNDKKEEPEFEDIREFEEFKIEFNIKEPLSEEILPTVPEPPKENDRLNSKTPAVADDNLVPEAPALNGKTITREANYDNYENLEHFDFAATCDDLLGDKKRGPRHLVVLGSHNLYRKELIGTMTKGRVSTKVIESERGQSIELGKVTTPSNRTMEIFGLSTERKFLQMLDQMESKLIGLVILVVANNSANLGYLGYLINSLKERLSAPFVIAVHQPQDTNPIPLDFIRYSLNLDEKEQLVNIKLSELDSVTHVLNQLKSLEYTQPHSTQDTQKRVQNHA